MFALEVFFLQVWTPQGAAMLIRSLLMNCTKTAAEHRNVSAYSSVLMTFQHQILTN